MEESRGERWFWRLVGLAAVIGSISYCTWLLPGLTRLLGASAGLLALIFLIVWTVRARDARRGLAARAVRLDREGWVATLPKAASAGTAMSPTADEEHS
jgi:hypothetical protein